jgi:hypothetical protein
MHGEHILIRKSIVPQTGSDGLATGVPREAAIVLRHLQVATLKRLEVEIPKSETRLMLSPLLQLLMASVH